MSGSTTSSDDSVYDIYNPRRKKDDADDATVEDASTLLLEKLFLENEALRAMLEMKTERTKPTARTKPSESPPPDDETDMMNSLVTSFVGLKDESDRVWDRLAGDADELIWNKSSGDSKDEEEEKPDKKKSGTTSSTLPQ